MIAFRRRQLACLVMNGTFKFAIAAALAAVPGLPSRTSDAASGISASPPAASTTAVSPADPKTVYKASRDLRVSHDAGETWEFVGPLPEAINDLAASKRDLKTLYAATKKGLLISRNAGLTWAPLLGGKPASIVEVTAEGVVYAFIINRGLVRSQEEPLRFIDLDYYGGFLFYLAADPAGMNRFVRDER
jgi:hypothetical protein